MSFIDKLGKKVINAGEKTFQKTKDFADISRLNVVISENEKLINNAYFQIGKLYVSLHRNDCTEDFLPLINAIAEAEEKIGSCKKQIESLKGLQRCPTCGMNVSVGAMFCSACGTPMPKVTAAFSAAGTCRNCGAALKQGMHFCTTCGTPVESIPANGSFAAEATAPIPNASEPDLFNGASSFGTPLHYDEEANGRSGKTCPNCYAQMEDDLLFCTECGTQL